MEWWLLCWLVLFTNADRPIHDQLPSCKKSNNLLEIQKCINEIKNILKNGTLNNSIGSLEILEQTLEETNVSRTTHLSQKSFVILIYKIRAVTKRSSEGSSKEFEFHASDEEANKNRAATRKTVSIKLRVDGILDDTIVFSKITWPEVNRTSLRDAGELHDSRLVGLSVRGKNESRLQVSVNITVAFPANETREPRCVFLNFSTKSYSSDGCKTQRGQSNLTCSCNHLTYFGVLMVSPSSLTSKDQEILSYITLIGCSLSLFALIITVLLFITKRKVREDVSMKVHINLAIALILLNLHFLPSQWVATLSSTGLCLYVALSLHYSLLASFSWMALEGFHLYLLLVRVFNIYIRRYLLKLSVVGWGVPAVIVSLVTIIDRDSYGRVSLDVSNPNSTAVCYILNTTVKMVTTVGVFGLVFVSNMIMLVVTVRRIMGFHPCGEFGQFNRDRAKRGVYTLLGVNTLLGITWGLVFFSFGELTTTGLYIFCILNPLQGFFIFLWFVMSWRKTGNPTTTKSSVTPSTNS